VPGFSPIESHASVSYSVTFRSLRKRSLARPRGRCSDAAALEQIGLTLRLTPYHVAVTKAAYSK
jgi:hypothetical protein